MKNLFTGQPKASDLPSSNTSTSKLGTFGGVFTPSILTILGVIMYLRFGWVVGNVGLVGTLIIVTLATSITFLTVLSVSAIATDRIVRAGGAYYIISRSLGIETGGAVGIPLYFAQAISVALYAIGFAESVVRTFSFLDQQLVAIVTAITVTGLAILSAQTAIRAQYFIMAAIGFSLISLLFGKPLEATDIELFGAGEGLSQPFWTVFAVFFPAVTGIMSGVNMSGDLKNPTRSIPVGTLAAVGVGYLIYMGLPVLLANRADASTLIADPLIMTKISMWGPSILLGVWGATLSSALGSILGAPRVLQALARDKVLPRWMLLLGTGTGKNDEPRIGTIVTLGIVLAAVMLGDLDVIAPVLSMFFLTTYLVLNLAAGIEGFLDSPSFRPTFQVHWSLSILGAIGCLAVMFLINPVATVAAALIVAAIYFWLQRRELTTSWGDSRRGMWMAMLRQGIYQLSKEEDTKNWQPHLLVFSGAPTKRWSLIEFANALVNERGIVTIASVLPSGSRDGAQQENMETTIRDYVENRGLEALVRVMTASNPFDGMRQMVEIYGIGPLRPNTIVLGSSNDSEHLEDYTDALVQLHQAKRNVVIFQENSQQGFGKRRHIDVWWSGAQGNGGLMLLLADLLRNDADWNQAQLHLKLIVQDESAIAAAGRNVKLLLNQLRIDAECQIIQAVGRPFHVILKETSQRADLIFLGLATPNGSNYAQYYHELQQHSTDLPSTVFVLASPSFTFTDVLTQS